MKNYKVLRDFYKISEKKNYVKNDEIELTDEEAVDLAIYGYIGDTYENSEEGTKGKIKNNKK